MKFAVKIYNLLDYRHKIYFFSLTVLNLLLIFLEVISVGSIFPLALSIFDSKTFAETKIYDLVILFFDTFKLNYSDNKSVVYILSILLFSLIIIKNIFSILTLFVTEIIGNKLIYYIKLKYLKNYLNTDISSKDTKHSTDFIRSVQTDCEGLVSYLVGYVSLIAEIILIVSFLMLLLIANFKATLISIIIMSLLFFIILFYTQNVIQISQKKIRFFGLQDLRGLQNIYNSIITIKLFSKQKFFLNSYFKIIKNSLRSQLIKSVFKSLPKHLIEIMIVLMIIIILLIFDTDEIFKKISNSLTFLTLVGFTFIRLIPSSNKLMQCMHTIKALTIHAKMVLREIYSFEERIKKDDLIKDHINDFKKIKFTTCNFSFHNKSVLKNLNLEITRGQKILLNGQSGSGKTTFINLLIGYLKADSGTIYYDEKILKSSLQFKKNFFSYVKQKDFILNETIRDNIIFGSESKKIDIDRLNKAIETADINSNNFSKNYLNFKIKENGSNLSGGQIQRILIARSLYVLPLILILDEATNALDKKSELKIFQNIRNKYPNMTIISVSHHNNNLAFYDKIYDISNLSKI